MSERRGRYGIVEQFPQFFEADTPGYGLSDGGIWTRPGWDGIITDLLTSLTALGLPPKFRILQIKEKFGELRVHYNHATDGKHDIVRALIVAATERSVNTCESCGIPASRMKEGERYLTTCLSCLQRKSEL